MPPSKTRRQYSGGAVQTTLTAHVGATDTQINGADFSTWPSGQSGATLLPVAAVINAGGTNEEKIYYSPRSGNTLQNCERGADGTAAQVHEAGEVVLHCFTAQDADEANSHIGDGTTDDHGQYVHNTVARTVSANHTFTGNPTFAGTPQFSGSPVFNQPAEFKGQTVFDDNPRFKGQPVFDKMSQQTPATLPNTANVPQVGATGVPSDAGHSHGIDVTALEKILVDPGTVRWVAWDATPRTGWLKADGTAVSRTTYAATYALLGTKHGAGDGVTTFNLPNLVGKFAHGNTVVGGLGGIDNVTLNTANLPAHNHGVNINDTGHNHGVAGQGVVNNVLVSPGGAQQNYLPANQDSPGPGAHAWQITASHNDPEVTGITASSTNTGGGQSFDNRPSYVDLMPIIKVH